MFIRAPVACRMGTKCSAPGRMKTSDSSPPRQRGKPLSVLQIWREARPPGAHAKRHQHTASAGRSIDRKLLPDIADCPATLWQRDAGREVGLGLSSLLAGCGLLDLAGRHTHAIRVGLRCCWLQSSTAFVCLLSSVAHIHCGSAPATTLRSDDGI